MRIVDYYRHGPKDGSFISEEGMRKTQDLARNLQGLRLRDGGNGFRPSISHIVAGTLARTWQTAAAFLAAYNSIASIIVLPAIPEFGDSDLFQSWLDRDFREAVAKHGTNLAALRSILTQEEFEGAKKTALAGVMKVFSAMKEGNQAIAFGHSPIIELAALAAVESSSITTDPDVERFANGEIQLAELKGIRFILDADKNLYVELAPC